MIVSAAAAHRPIGNAAVEAQVVRCDQGGRKNVSSNIGGVMMLVFEAMRANLGKAQHGVEVDRCKLDADGTQPTPQATLKEA
jgi:hypothetical protein